MMKRSLHLLTFLLASSIGAALAAPPSAPTGVCIEHAEGVDCAASPATPTGSTGGAATNIVAPKSVKPENFHPGYYLSVGESRESPETAFSSLKNLPEFVGGKRMYLWKDLEPSKGNYDFSLIEQDLKYLQSIGKRLWIQIYYTQFNGSLPPNTPKYMWSDSSYGCEPQYYGNYPRNEQDGGWIPCFWNSNVSARFTALYSALGARFNTEPYFEGISIGETAVDTATAKTYSGYSTSSLYSATQTNALSAKSAFPNKSVMQLINYAPFDLVIFSEWLNDNKIGIGGPDVHLFKTGLINTAYPQYIKYHDSVPTGPDVQWDNYARINPDIGRTNTVEELLLGAIKYTNPWYMFWQKREPYFSNEVVPTIRTYGNLPAANLFYESMNKK